MPLVAEPTCVVIGWTRHKMIQIEIEQEATEGTEEVC